MNFREFPGQPKDHQLLWKDSDPRKRKINGKKASIHSLYIEIQFVKQEVLLRKCKTYFSLNASIYIWS
jgi:hypothetical protein